MSSSVQTPFRQASTVWPESGKPQASASKLNASGARNSEDSAGVDVDSNASQSAMEGFVASSANLSPLLTDQNKRFAALHWLGLAGTVATFALVFASALGAGGNMAGINGLLGASAVALFLHFAAYTVFARTDHVSLGACLSAITFTLALSVACFNTGGIESSLVYFFILAPIEALLTRHKRCALLVAGVAVGAFLLSTSFAGGNAELIAIAHQGEFALNILALLYALSLAARVAKLASIRDLGAVASQRAIDQFHAVTHDVFAILRRDGSVDRVFGAVGPVLHCGKDDLRAFGLIDRMHIADRPQFLTAVDEVHMRQNRASVEVRLRMGPSGCAQRFIWTAIDLSAIAGLNDEREVYALIRDISQTKEHEAGLTLAREKAEANDAAKGRFLATMSHELRTPLNAIIGFADILDEEVFGSLANDQQREYVGLIRESGGHLLQLVNDLLDMSKLEAGHFHIVAEPFAVRAIVDRCTRLMSQEIAKQQQTLDVDIPEGLPELNADQRAVRQIVINLLSNASKFTPSGGKITLRTRRDGASMVLSIADTGIGISAKDMKKIGEPFFQANGQYNRNHQGTGLGLSVVKGLSELHEGTMRVTSIEGEGTTVTIRLPIAGPTPEEFHAQVSDEKTRASNATVLAKLEQSAPRTLDTTSSAAAHAAPSQEEERLRAHG